MSFFKSLEKAVNNLGSDISREVGYVSRDVNRSLNSVASSAILDQLRNGNIVQLVSRTSGRALEIVMSPNGSLVVDGQGPEGPAIYHAHWTIINLGNNIVQLHNNNNYVAIVNGCTLVGQFPPPATPGPETQFRAVQHGNFISLESIREPGRHVGIMADGQVKSALATGASDNDAHFGIRVIYVTPAGAQAPVQKKK